MRNAGGKREEKGIRTIILQWRAREKHIHKGRQATSIKLLCAHTHTHLIQSIFKLYFA